MNVQEPTTFDLREGFDAFIEAAKCLEESYSALKARAEEVDLRLAETNQRLESALDERETLFRALPIGLLALDGNGRPGFSNPEAKRILALIGEQDPASLVDGQVVEDACTVRVQRVALPDGGTMVLLEDRTRLTHLEGEVHRLDRLAGLSELALGIAHEIKNPLNGVMGFAELMGRAKDMETCRRYANRIGTGLDQVDAIVKALLGFARPRNNAGKRESIASLVEQAAATANIAPARITLTGAVSCMGDVDALGRTLANLFRNSVEAAGGDVHLAVDISEGSNLVLTIEDDGPGVSNEIAPRIIDPFVTSKDKGHGLGLALSARVLGFLGGRLQLCNPGESGARFRITLPRTAPEASRE